MLIDYRNNFDLSILEIIEPLPPIKVSSANSGMTGSKSLMGRAEANITL